MDAIGNPDGTACKINHANNVFWTAALLLEIVKWNFRVSDFVDGAIRKSGSVLDRIAAFEAAFVPKLEEILLDLKRLDGNYFSAHYENNFASQVMFASFDGVAHLHLRQFLSKTNETGTISVSVLRGDCPGSDCAPIQYVSIGAHTFADAELRNNPNLLSHPASAVDHLIETEIANDPALVGPPISIVKITNMGSDWHSTGECRAD